MKKICVVFILIILSIICNVEVIANDLNDIKRSGMLRHLGVPYANFVTGSGDGMSVELMKLFSDHLGVKYVYVKTDWKNVIPDLSGKVIGKNSKGEYISKGTAEIKGDVISNGLTILDWRKKFVDYSDPVFPTQVWLIARSNLLVFPIKPTNDIRKDILETKKKIQGFTILGKPNTCLDTKLYKLEQHGADLLNTNRSLNEIAPLMMNKISDMCILDVPDALVALEKFPGKIKVIGPISVFQKMGVGFSKNSPKLREEFNKFLKTLKKNGRYLEIIKKYYPDVFEYYPDFFREK